MSIETNQIPQIGQDFAAGFQGFVDLSSLIAVPNTAIAGRAKIPDLVNDLCARMAIDRIMTPTAVLLQGESGANGETVFGAVNDTLGLIRFVGNWSSNIFGAYGNFVSSSTSTNDYMEVTFYGTGLNIIAYNVTMDLRATVDGGSEGANVIPSTVNQVLGNRGYGPNMVFPAVSGLTPGLHTVKIRSASVTSAFNMHGLEILNESTLVKVNPGSAYINGVKLQLAAQSTPAYNASVTGTKGGRVLTYLTPAGAVAQAFQATNASQLVFPNVDHTNEEIARVYSPREFGSGRTDDFSTLVQSNSPRAFTLDDGTTTLVGLNARVTTQNNAEHLYLGGASGNFYVFTFVGTGLDIVWSADATGTNGSSTAFQVFVDGNLSYNWSTLSPGTNTQVQKVVSGLPYGTHTVRLIQGSVSAWNVLTKSFIVYQPKKPTLPAGAVELADYNVMADFVGNTVVGRDTMSTGVLRKPMTREALFVGSNWSANLSITGSVTGFEVGTGTHVAGNSVSYTFFGTGVELRGESNGSTQTNVAVTINGLAATTANFPSMLSSVYGFTSLTAGVLNSQGAGGDGSGLIIRNLPLGLYTIKFTLAQTVNWWMDAFDVITPIHSYKSNLYVDFQNTLNIGSQGISDNRKLTPVKDSLQANKSWVQAQGVTSSPTTSATSFVPMPDMSVTIRTTGGPLELFYSYLAVQNTANANVNATFYVDGVVVGSTRISVSPIAGAGAFTAVDSIIVPVAPGVHKVDVYWSVSSGTVTALGGNRLLKAREI